MEPDTRGVSTIREILAKHREIETCNSCDRDIDPYGFELEGFDVMGAERTHYRAVGGQPIQDGGHNRRPFEFHYSLSAETDRELLSCEKFGVRTLIYEVVQSDMFRHK